MLFSITNHQNDYTLESTSFELACLAVLLLGQGKYGLKQLDGNSEMPPLLLLETGEWVRKTFNKDFTAWLYESLKENSLAISEIMSSVLFGEPADREPFFDNLSTIQSEAKKTRWRKKWLMNRNPSYDDLCVWAWEYADFFKNRVIPKTNRITQFSN